MVRLSPLTFRVVGETVRQEETALTSARDDRDHVGLYLREAREALGRDVDEIALALRIRPAHLQAIEDGRFVDLPGPTYAVGFIRTYADFLGLDGAAIVARFKGEALSYSTARPDLDFIAAPEARFPSGALLLGIMLVAVGGFVGWSYLNRDDRSVVERVAEPPALVAEAPEIDDPASEVTVETAAIEAPAEAAPASPVRTTLSPVVDLATPVEDVVATSAPLPETAETAEEGVSDPPAALATLPSSADTQVGAAAPASETDAAPAVSPGAAIAAEPEPEATAVETEPEVASLPAVPAVTARNEGGRAYGQVNVDARIILTATADSWVQIRDARQNVLLTRMLQPGDSYRVPNRTGLTLLTGNAGGLRVEVDGTEVARLGPLGAVRRDIRLNPEALKTDQPAP